MRKSLLMPKRLYKYRAFSALTMDLLVRDKVFFADPSTFNDPLDTRPCLEIDIGAQELAAALQILTERRIGGEMMDAARKIRYRGPKTMDHIGRHSKRQAERVLEEISYSAKDPDYSDSESAHLSLLGHHLERELLRQYDKGILSLAERYDCPLMWSHYGDQHNGICIGYSATKEAPSALHQVDYGGSRLVQASQVAAMLSGNDAARKLVDAAVLLRKAPAWKYEKEWRLIGPRGLADSPLEMTSVTFGTRSLDAVKHTVARALAGRDKKVNFYEMHEVHGTFRLTRSTLDADNLEQSYPRRALSQLEGFDDLIDGDA